MYSNLSDFFIKFEILFNATNICKLKKLEAIIFPKFRSKITTF